MAETLSTDVIIDTFYMINVRRAQLKWNDEMQQGNFFWRYVIFAMWFCYTISFIFFCYFWWILMLMLS